MTAALLLAEPEPATRGYLERQLASDGFHVLQTAFGGEALALAERTRPDLVVCSELDLCARLREGEPGRTWNRDVPVIVLGPEEADAVDRVRAFQRGADDYLPRPVVYDELLARIRAVLRRTSPPCPDLIEVGELAIDRLGACRDRARRARPSRGQGVRAARRARGRAEAACSRRTSCCETSGDTARSPGPARSTRTSHDCGRSSSGRRATTSSSTSGAWATSSSLDGRAGGG